MMLFGKSFAKRLAGTSFLQSNCQSERATVVAIQSKIHLRIFQSEQATDMAIQSELAFLRLFKVKQATDMAIQSEIILLYFFFFYFVYFILTSSSILLFHTSCQHNHQFLLVYTFSHVYNYRK